ncbi:sensor histidine kinase [Streptomyces odontomachi]|uniref:sensor histidine kinase n=1 Tax=Streptomyces odontomachi TaxID=2944940 RepID=UPI002108F8BD|nr:HAMP domain-containing sensor histidine kinase [Streptomyces sp. ODS25]
MKLSTRIALAVGLAVVLLVLALGWLLLAFVGRDLQREEDAQVRARATALVPDARELLRLTAADRPKASDARERRLYDAALDMGVRLIGPDATFTAGPQPGASVPLPDRARKPVTVRAGERSWRTVSVSVHSAGHRASGTLWVFSPDTADRARLAAVRRRVVSTALLAAPLSGLLAGGVAGGAIRPLRRLRRRAAGLDPRLSPARLHHEPTGVREVDDLAATLETVLARYDEQVIRSAQALDTARSFSSAASHELRTPLMSMGTNLDILTEHPELPEPDRGEVLGDLRREHRRLLGLLVMLRELARGDLVEAESFRLVDVAEIADAAIADARRSAPGAGITLSTGAGAGPTMHAWEPGIRLLFDNLLANALAHGRGADGCAEVEVSVHRAGSAVLITVDDRGPGVPADTRAEIFRRFHRGPTSTGSGLGLTLVAQQAALHGGTVEAGAGRDGAGARFTVRLPAPGGELPRQRDWFASAPHEQVGDADR